MAKLTFNKLGLTKNQDIKTIEFNDQIIEVKQYLPVNDKLTLISDVINLSADENNFANPIKTDIYFYLELVSFYTNITFTDKQKEDPCKLYDLLEGSGLLEQIYLTIPEGERSAISNGVSRSVRAVYDYRNSVYGILDAISTDYNNLDLDATNIQEKIANPENLTLLKDVLTKLG
jgi:hypothetical protein